MRRYVHDAAVLARKDVLLELRGRDTLPAMVLFVLAGLVVFHFALPGGAAGSCPPSRTMISALAPLSEAKRISVLS